MLVVYILYRVVTVIAGNVCYLAAEPLPVFHTKAIGGYGFLALKRKY